MIDSSGSPPSCGRCRHANHGTDDAAEGFLACPWFGATAATSSCRVVLHDPEALAYEEFDGNNGTWQVDAGWRSLPAGYENRSARVVGIEPAVNAVGELNLNDRDYTELPWRFLQCDPECYAFRKPDSYWKALWSGGDLGSGTLLVSNVEIVFIRSSAGQRLACRGPLPSSEGEIRVLLEAQGGLRVPLDAIRDAAITFQGMGTYGYGKAVVAEVTISDSQGRITRFKFLGTTAAEDFRSVVCNR
jgi:hypothetical protein